MKNVPAVEESVGSRTNTNTINAFTVIKWEVSMVHISKNKMILGKLQLLDVNKWLKLMKWSTMERNIHGVSLNNIGNQKSMEVGSMMILNWQKIVKNKNLTWLGLLLDQFTVRVKASNLPLIIKLKFRRKVLVIRPTFITFLLLMIQDLWVEHHGVTYLQVLDRLLTKL